MKKNNSLYILIIYLFFCILQLQPEGFFAGTLVKTASGNSLIEQLSCNDAITSYNHASNRTTSLITQNITCHSNSYIKITVADSILCCAPDQKFYSNNQQQWVTADQLTSTDFLMCDNGHSIAIDEVEIIQEQSIFHALSLETNHTYSVSQHNILAHNIVVVIPLFFSNTPVIVPIVKTCFMAGASLLGIRFAKKFAHKNNHSSVTQTTTPPHFPQKNPNDNDGDNDKYNTNKYPNGIYKDAGYHHKNSHGTKSKSPKNGQTLLNNAIRVEKSEDTLIAVEDNYFVVFYKTMEREFHGHVREWKQLTDHMKNTLINHGLVKRSGKIIRQMMR